MNGVPFVKPLPRLSDRLPALADSAVTNGLTKEIGMHPGG